VDFNIFLLLSSSVELSAELAMKKVSPQVERRKIEIKMHEKMKFK